jgi:choline dehydrogenase-like flavoprotein
MKIDSGTLAPDARLDAEVAVVGAGPAGIVTALELARAGHRVLLIESGDRSFNPKAQDLAETVGHDPSHVSMLLATRRQIGGASNLWGGRCVPFDPVDFEQREIAGDVSWPVTYEEMARYFQRTCEWCVCGDAVFNVHEVPELAGRSLVPGFADGRVMASALERWSLPTNFGRIYRSALENTPGLTFVTNLNCTEVVCDESGCSVEHLRAEDLAGKRVTITAKRYVLACGGLGVTRLLFASDKHHPAGLGNHSGHLGRWYMAHVEMRVARVHFSTPPQETIYSHERDAAGVYVRRRMTFSHDFLMAEQLPNTAIWLVNPELSDPSHGSGVLSFVYLMLASPLGRYFVAEGIRQIHIRPSGSVSIRGHLANVLRNLGSATWFALKFGYQRFLKRGRKVPGFFVPSTANVYPVMYHGEHLPRYESRVEPTETRDALGMPRLRTHLLLADDDVRGVLRAHGHLDDYLREHNLGHVEYLYGEDELEATIREQFAGGYHQAGTTRMSAHPEDGVVDRDLAIHGFDDLFIASSSTLVTSSQANSTFMIVAFALRLADHLHQQLAGEADGPRLADHDRQAAP